MSARDVHIAIHRRMIDKFNADPRYTDDEKRATQRFYESLIADIEAGRDPIESLTVGNAASFLRVEYGYTQEPE